VNLIAAQGKPTSSKEVAMGKINEATITINYGSPSVNNRPIWGALVPFNQVWRAGANDATTFETDKDLTIEGAKLPAGKYSFFVIPNEKNVSLFLIKKPNNGALYKYKDKEDQLRVTVSHTVAKVAVESGCIQSTRKCCSKLGKWNIPIIK
jgi:hypothetical protein